MALIRDIGYKMENFKVLNKNPQTNNMNQTKGSGKKDNEEGNKKWGHSEISTHWKKKSVELKGIWKEILNERKKVKMYLKYDNGPHKWYEWFAKEPITTKTIAKIKEIP